MSRKSAGLRAWLWQRLSAVYMLLFLSYFFSHMILNTPRSYVEWQGWVATPIVSIASALFFFLLLLHAWVGLRDVIMDYVHSVAIRLAVLSFTGLALIGMAFWVLRILYLAS